MKASKTIMSHFFKQAHRMTKAVMRVGDSYAITFKACLKMAMQLIKDDVNCEGRHALHIFTMRADKAAQQRGIKQKERAYDMQTGIASPAHSMKAYKRIKSVGLLCGVNTNKSDISEMDVCL